MNVDNRSRPRYSPQHRAELLRDFARNPGSAREFAAQQRQVRGGGGDQVSDVRRSSRCARTRPRAAGAVRAEFERLNPTLGIGLENRFTGLSHNRHSVIVLWYDDSDGLDQWCYGCTGDAYGPRQ